MKFIQLVRPVNLIIIALTMCGVFYFLSDIPVGTHELLNQINFVLLVFSTLLIAGAGNIINDYFDVKADRVNKPDRLIISKHIKRRWAIVTHWFFNGIALLIAVYLSFVYLTYSFVFIHLLSINLLWFYSFVFKRKGVFGNIIVALLTALIPILTLLFFESIVGETKELNDKIDFIYCLAFFAFIQNLAREIIKDIQDIKGDQLINAQTLPIKLGVRKSHFIVVILLLIFPVIFGIYLLNSFPQFALTFIELIPFYSVGLINSLVIALVIFSGERTIATQDHLVKLSMLAGLLSLFI